MNVAALRTHYRGTDGKLRLSSVDYWRLDNPLSHIKKHQIDFINKVVSEQNPAGDWEAKGNKYDVFWSSYTDTPKAYAYLRAVGEMFGAKVIMDIDDNVFEVDEMAPAHLRYFEGSEHLERIKTIIGDVPILTASTSFLAKTCARYRTKPIFVLPNYIDPKVYVYDPRLVPHDERIVIAYQGSSTHYSDLVKTNALFALRRIVNKYPQVDIHFIGCLVDDFKLYFPPDRVKFIGGAQDHKKWRKVWQTFRCDIGLAPLLTSNFNRAKSSIKYYEYSLRRIPALYSFIDPYLSCVQENKTGFLFQDEEELYEKLTWLVENETLRRRMADEAAKDVLVNYTIDKHWRLWQDVLGQ